MSSPTPYVHPKSLADFEALYEREYKAELASCDEWIAWCKERNDYYGVNFHQGRQSAIVYNNIKMGQLIRIFKREEPNVDTEPAAETVELTHLAKVLEYLARIESMTLAKIVWTHNGQPVTPSRQDVDDWKYTGLNNRDFAKEFLLPAKHESSS